MRSMFGGGHLNDVRLKDGAVPVFVQNLPSGGGLAAAGTDIFGTGGFSTGGGTAGEYREQIGLAARSGGLGTRFRRFIEGGPTESRLLPPGGGEPSGSEAAMLAEIRRRESSGSYAARVRRAQPLAPINSSIAHGAWRPATGVGGQYKTARKRRHSCKTR